MKINLPGAFADAWSAFRGNSEVLIALAGLFLFVPTLALLLLVPAAPPWPDSTAGDPQVRADAALFANWLVDNSRWFLVASLASLFGSLAICAFLLDRQSADLRAALQGAVRLLPRYMAAALLILLPASLGVFVFILPGLYILGRTMLVAPALVSERGLTATAAIMRSITLTRRNGLVLAGLTGLGLLVGQVLPAPFQSIDIAMRAAGAANPVMITIVDCGAAALASAVALATILMRIAIYRQLASSNGT
ncbi:hypothetical protein [Sphingomonas sp. 28-63-12]|uniref:hypothetical protein n=1 Tax=Sphingomonas sp. 28-63-12 TaxID=1970434 RepID=UPI000BC3F59C|nr:MAG: hypothetical protein B7Y47_03530 [Sphingomonas sp. 28-63-12]